MEYMNIYFLKFFLSHMAVIVAFSPMDFIQEPRYYTQELMDGCFRKEYTFCG